MSQRSYARMHNIDARVMTMPPIAAGVPPIGISAGIAASPDGPVLALTLTPVDGTAVVALVDVDRFTDLVDLLTLVGSELTAGRYSPLETRQ